MQINATLSTQDTLAIAIHKGRTATVAVTQVVDGVTSIVEVDNPLTPADFLQRVYEQYIIDDATSILTEDRTKALKDQMVTIEETTRQEVEASVRA